MMVIDALTQALATGRVRVVDLTQTLAPAAPVIVLPTEFGQCAQFRMEEVAAYDHRGPAWKWHNISMSEHTGTHFDAPSHWVTGRNVPHGTTDAIDPGMFVGPVCVIDCSDAVAGNPDFMLEPAHVQAWEDRHGPIPAGAWVLLRTDWSLRQGADYVNLKPDGAHSPGPSPAAVRALLSRDIRGFGTETIGTDAGQAQYFDPPYPAHSLLHGAGKYGLQCLRNLDRLPATGAMLICPPLKIQGGTGSPLRVLALVEETP